MATDRLTVSEVETVIRQLKDVLGARVVSDAAGVIQEIHVLTRSDRAPKQVVRDVESALQARLGISLDHKKVSVAQVQSGDRQATAVCRPEFANVSISLSGQMAEATVLLKQNEETFTGSALGPTSSGGQLKAVASATLKAVQEYSTDIPTLMVEDATSCLLGGQQVVVVLVTVVGNRSDETLSGSCVVKQDAVKAAVFATLDAVNRRLTRAT